MDIDTLNCFINVAECLSFAQAAKQMYVSQSSLSNRIASLEKELNVSLIERTTRSVALTPAGEYFLMEAKNITRRLGEVTLRTRELASGSQGSLSVGYLDLLGYDFMEQVVTNFQRDLPGVTLTIHKHTYRSLFKALNDMNSDIGIMVPPMDSLPQALKKEPVLSARMKFLTRKDNPLAAKSSIKISDLKHEPLLAVCKEDAATLHDTISRIFARQGLIPKRIIECDGPEEMLLSVASGMGSAIVSGFMYPSLKRNDDVCIIPITHILDTYNLYIISHKDNPNTCIQRFMEIAHKAARELCDSGAPYTLL